MAWPNREPRDQSRIRGIWTDLRLFHVATIDMICFHGVPARFGWGARSIDLELSHLLSDGGLHYKCVCVCVWTLRPPIDGLRNISSLLSRVSNDDFLFHLSVFSNHKS